MTPVDLLFYRVRTSVSQHVARFTYMYMHVLLYQCATAESLQAHKTGCDHGSVRVRVYRDPSTPKSRFRPSFLRS
jgi:hypothetical protein